MWLLVLLLLAQLPPAPVTIPNSACDTLRAQSVDEMECIKLCLEEQWELSSCAYCCTDVDDLEIVKR